MYDDINECIIKVQKLNMSISRDLAKYDQIKLLHDHTTKHGIDRTFLQLFDAKLLNSVFKTNLPSYESLYEDAIYDHNFITATESFLGELFSSIVDKMKSVGRSIRKGFNWLFDYLKFAQLKLDEFKDKMKNIDFKEAYASYDGYTPDDTLKALTITPVNGLRTLINDTNKVIDTYLCGRPNLNNLDNVLHKLSATIAKYDRDVKAMPDLGSMYIKVNQAKLNKVIADTSSYVNDMLKVRKTFEDTGDRLIDLLNFWGETQSTTISTTGGTDGANTTFSQTTKEDGDYSRIAMSFVSAICFFGTTLIDHTKLAVKSTLNLCDAAFDRE